MSHLEDLIAEYLDWDGYLVKRNRKVGRRAAGGWEMELDLVGYHPESGRLVHYEPSLDGLPWGKREERYKKKFKAGKRYILKEVFPWLPSDTHIEQIAIFNRHPKDRDSIAGAAIIGVDELMDSIREQVRSQGLMVKNAIPEQFPLLRTLQLTHCGYTRAP